LLLRISRSSGCIDAGTTLDPACLPDHALDLEYLQHQSSKARASNGALDISAYEHPHGGGVPTQVQALTACAVADTIIVRWLGVESDTCGLPVVVDFYRVYVSQLGHFAPLPVLMLDQVADTTYKN
jgi:hypothetical protein